MQIFFSGAIPTQNELLGITAVLGIIDAESGELLHLCEYETPLDLQAPEQRKMQFSGHCLLEDGRVYACCHNEVMEFSEWPPRVPTSRIRDPGFNDLHHCIPWNDGLAVANTGLETVDHVSLDGDLLYRWDLLEGMPDTRLIDPDVDYGRIADTTPHVVHGNHLFVRDGELWVTQCKARRAVCLTADAAEISFGEGMPHDGRWIGGRLVFTTTRGGLVIVDPDSLETVATHDLGPMTPGAKWLGWCRGVCEDPRDPNSYFVAFTIFRVSRHRDFGFWIKHGHKKVPSRIDRFDLERQARAQSMLVLPDQPLVLFQLDLVPEHLRI